MESKRKTPKKLPKKTDHDSEFRPSCCKKYDVFSYPEYQPGGRRSEKKKTRKGNETERADTFKPVKNPNFYKPSPSVTTLRTNIMRSIRWFFTHFNFQTYQGIKFLLINIWISESVRYTRSTVSGFLCTWLSWLFPIILQSWKHRGNPNCIYFL